MTCIPNGTIRSNAMLMPQLRNADPQANEALFAAALKNTPYSNFDIIGSISRAFLAHFSAPPHPPHAPFSMLLVVPMPSHRVLIGCWFGAWNPCCARIWGFRLGDEPSAHAKLQTTMMTEGAVFPQERFYSTELTDARMHA